MPLDNVGPAHPYAGFLADNGFIPANHREAVFEQVEPRKLYDEKGVELPGWLRIHNVTRNKDIHVASDAYRIITNEEAFTAFDQALETSGLDLTDLAVGTDYSHAGARIFRQYVFPAHIVPVKPGVDVALRIVMFNSYDGTMAFKGLAGAFNFVCANTAVFGKEVAGFSFKHAGKPDVTSAAKSLVAAAEAFATEAEGWRRWPAIGVSDKAAVEVFAALPGASDSTVEHLSLRWLTARDGDPMQGGANAWALFNVLTAWATHTEGKGESKNATRYAREGAVRKVLDMKEWKAVVAA